MRLPDEGIDISMYITDVFKFIYLCLWLTLSNQWVYTYLSLIDFISQVFSNTKSNETQDYNTKAWGKFDEMTKCWKLLREFYFDLLFFLIHNSDNFRPQQFEIFPSVHWAWYIRVCLIGFMIISISQYYDFTPISEFFSINCACLLEFAKIFTSKVTYFLVLSSSGTIVSVWRICMYPYTWTK